MKIDGSDGRIPGVPSKGTPARGAASGARDGAAAAGRSGEDQVRLTSDARQASAIADRIATLPTIDRARVEAVSAAISRGEYRIDADRIAERMLALEQDLN
jgi:negative regulator of flagellin synthesis FlgM